MASLLRTGPLLLRGSVLPLSARALSTTPLHQKTATEAVKDTAKTIDRTVADAAVSGIEMSQQLKEKTQEATGLGTKKAGQTAEELAGEAKGKKEEFMGKAKGTAEEVAGKARGTAEEVKGRM
ncbi:MAG: hypothetical protein M1832_005578 [Thelocarpon impressellum]|nr:MAG: hypothetical protein M1832_005578 [Thelocarpon impressellum]